ncbi:MAG: hypothetical protein ACKV0T_04505 [Planctomycetales bacterium]
MNALVPFASVVWRAMASRLVWGLVWCGCALSSVVQGAPQETSGASTSAGSVTLDVIEVGIGGRYKVGEWTPVRLTVRTGAPQTVTVVVDAPDADDNLASTPGARVSLQPGAAVRLESVFRTGRMTGEIHVRLVDDSGNTLISRRMTPRDNADETGLSPALRQNIPLWVTLVDLPVLRTGSAGSSQQPSSTTAPGSESPYDPVVVRLRQLTDLPSHPRGLASVDVLVLPAAGSVGETPLWGEQPEAQSALLREWVRGGGHLIVSATDGAAGLQDSPLAGWLPAPVEGEAQVRQLTGLESFAGVNAPLRFAGTLKVPRLATLPHRNVLVREGGLAMIAEASYGFGRVTLIGLDLQTPPLVNWPGLPIVLRKLAGGAQRAAAQQPRQGNRQLTNTGISDLGTQFQSAQEDFPSVPRPSRWWVMGLLIAYLLVVGPLDYLVVNHWLRRPALTWLTLPVLIGLGAGGAIWSAGRINGTGFQFNQLDLIDFDTTTQSYRGRTWVSLYSPENARYSVAVEPGAANPGAIAWMGVPENSVSGIYRPGGAVVHGRSYQFAEQSTAVENVPILQWSTKSLEAEWTPRFETSLLDCRLDSAGAGQLTGSITHHLPQPLEECLLVVGGWAYAPTAPNGRLDPGVPWQPGGPQGRARDLKALLTGESRTRKDADSLRTEILTTTVPYNPLDVDRVDLVRMISFHQAVGGSEYTGLGHAPLRMLEMTHLMQLGRGILLGRMKSPTARVVIDGQSSEPADGMTFVRLVVPVQHRDRARSAIIPKAGERAPGP